MKDKKDNRNFLLIPLDITDRIHLYSGPMRDLFANIYNFSKDGKHTYRASIDEIMAFLHVSENTARTYVNILLKSGFITRESKVVISKKESKHAKYEYMASIDGILARLDAGEDVWPVLPKKGSKIAPIIDREKGADSEGKRVQILRKKGANSAAQYNKESIRNSKEYLSTREEEEREFYKIFFMRNAADPAAEVMRFVGWYQSRGWKDGNGHPYDTMEKRAGLAWPWNIKTGEGRLPAGPDTEKFFAFLGDLYTLAVEVGGINPKQILDPLSDYVIDNRYGFIWRCSEPVQLWCESHVDALREIKARRIGAETGLFFDRYAA